MSVGSRLKKLRKEKDLTQKELSELLELGESTISHYERGDRQPDYKTLQKFADFFSVSIDYLLGRTDQRQANTSSEDEDNEFVKIPILGEVPAGPPIVAEENIIGYRMVHKSEVNGATHFFLKVTGDSMTGSRIRKGDKVLIREQPTVENGETAVVMVNSHEATLKKVYRADGKLILQPDNPDHDPIIVENDEVRIIGKVVGVYIDY